MKPIKTLFISDVHLGSRHSSTAELLAFLSEVKKINNPEKLYIVGDFIDGWKLKRNWYWTNESNLVLRKILSMLQCGTEVYYIAGNHDDFLRIFIEDFKIGDFGSIHIGDEFVHETANGEKFLVIHGDKFDLATQYAKWICVLGDIGYDVLLRLNSIVKWFRSSLGLKHWSLSKSVKSNVKKAIDYIGGFEKCLINYSKELHCNGCICGHIHTADLKKVDKEFVYVNCGDWVESCTAIYEDYEGNLHLYKHKNET